MAEDPTAKSSDTEKDQPATPGASATPSDGRAPLIFISHDTRDAELAERFSTLLSSVSAGVLKSFRSSDKEGSQGIEYGVEWYPELMSRLESASDVVCLLTQRSVDRPWILYEAGVAKGKLNTPVFGIALGIPLKRANSGPFAQFQNCDDKEESLTGLVMQLLRRIPGSEPNHDAVQLQVQTFKTDAGKLLKALDSGDRVEEEEPGADDASVAKLFEEIKVMFQDLPLRLQDSLSGEVGPLHRRRFRRFHPMILGEIASMVSQEPGDPMAILVLAGLVRDEMPWLYELAVEAYRTAKLGEAEATAKAMHTFRRAAEIATHGPLADEFASSREMLLSMQDLQATTSRVVEDYLARLEGV